MSGKLKLYEHSNFRGISMEIDLDNYSIHTLHSLNGTDIHDKLSSLSWEVDDDVIITMYEHTNGTGRIYSCGRGSGSNSSTHGTDHFGDCISSWRWIKVADSFSVMEAFSWIGTGGKKLTFHGRGIDLSGGHFQGVAYLNIRTLAISSSGDDIAKVFLLRWRTQIGEGEGELIREIVVGNSPFNHAGGIQISDNVLAVGVEDFNGRKKSKVKFFDLRDFRRPIELGHLEVNRSSNIKKRKTAGAVGLIKLNDRYLMITGSWNSETIDFYYSNMEDLLNTSCRFELFDSWEIAKENKNDWIDKNWGGYQFLNLVSFDNSNIYLIGGHNSSPHDWIDLYKIELASPPSHVRLVKVSKRHLFCDPDPSFEFAGGIIIDGTRLHVIATEEKSHSITSANLFESPGGITQINPNSARFLLNRRSNEVHSLENPCSWVKYIAPANIILIYNENELIDNNWCDFCFPERADG